MTLWRLGVIEGVGVVKVAVLVLVGWCLECPVACGVDPKLGCVRNVKSYCWQHSGLDGVDNGRLQVGKGWAWCWQLQLMVELGDERWSFMELLLGWRCS